jgi:DNA invertase Pin-like site-specific DNA recombinase
MIDDARKKEFQFIIVYKVDRFARNQYDSVVYKHKLLNDYGIKVLSATEAISNTNERRLVETLLEYMAEMYSTDLKQKVTRGLRESIIKGNFIGSKPAVWLQGS